MQRFINDPDDIVDETVRGFVKAHGDLVRQHPENARVVVAQGAPVAGKVGIVTGGGSGHEPAFIGYAGRNMVDAVAVGELFSSPTAKSFLDAIKAADGGNGVCVLYGNYAGDNMNVKMAARMAAKEGIEVLTSSPTTTSVSAPPEEARKSGARGGEILSGRSAARRAQEALEKRRSQAAAPEALDATRSVGVGLAPCTLRRTASPTRDPAGAWKSGNRPSRASGSGRVDLIAR